MYNPLGSRHNQRRLRSRLNQPRLVQLAGLRRPKRVPLVIQAPLPGLNTTYAKILRTRNSKSKLYQNQLVQSKLQIETIYTIFTLAMGLTHVGLDQRSCATSDSVSTRMDDLLWTGKPPRYVTNQLGRLSLLSSVGRNNEYQLSG